MLASVYYSLKAFCFLIKRQININTKNTEYGRPLNLLTCADSSTLLAPPWCTVGCFAKTTIYVLAVQPVCPIQQNYCNFWNIGTIKNPEGFKISKAVRYSQYYYCLHYLLSFRPRTHPRGGGGADNIQLNRHHNLSTEST